MFDFMRDRGDGGRQQEAIDAYLDNALTPAERARFEAQMAADSRLRAEVEQLSLLRLQLRAMPRRRVPRSFALNPAAYSRPKAQPLLQLYPALRGATALSAFLLIFVLALGLFRGQFGVGAPEAAQVASVTSEEVAPAAVEEAAEEAAQLTNPEEAADSANEAPAAESELAAAPTAEAAAELAASAPLGTITTTLPTEELSFDQAQVVEATLPPNAGGAVEPPATETAPPAVDTLNAVAQEAAVAEADEATARQEAPAPAETSRSLLPYQIGLGALFLLLLVLWLVARRRVRSL